MGKRALQSKWMIGVTVFLMLIMFWTIRNNQKPPNHSFPENNNTYFPPANEEPKPGNQPNSYEKRSDHVLDRYVNIESPLRYKGTAYPGNINGISPENLYPTVEPKEVPEKKYGSYKVRNGDTLSKIALMFNIELKRLAELNKLEKKDTIKVGQVLKIPRPQDVVDAFLTGAYEVKEGDTLIALSNTFKVDPKRLAEENNIINSADIYPGRIMIIPFSKEHHILTRPICPTPSTSKQSRFFKRVGKHKLRVIATAYTSHPHQTDTTPFLAAWNNRLCPGMKVIAVSRDLIYRYGLRNGTKVHISGLRGTYRVRDKMNKRYERRIDIYMGMNKQKALRWGRRSVVIYW